MNAIGIWVSAGSEVTLLRWAERTGELRAGREMADESEGIVGQSETLVHSRAGVFFRRRHGGQPSGYAGMARMRRPRRQALPICELGRQRRFPSRPQCMLGLSSAGLFGLLGGYPCAARRCEQPSAQVNSRNSP